MYYSIKKGYMYNIDKIFSYLYDFTCFQESEYTLYVTSKQKEKNNPKKNCLGG